MSDARNVPEPAPPPHVVNGAVNPHVRHERTDVNTRAVLWFVVALAGGLALVMLVLGAMFALFVRNEDTRKRSQFPLAVQERNQRLPADQLPPDPRLEGLSAQGLKQPPGRVFSRGRESARDQREQQDRELNSYGWVHGKADQVAHIPIEVAMERIVDKLPARKPREDGP